MKYSVLALSLIATPTALAAGDEKVAWYADPVTATAMAALIIFLIIAGWMGAFKAVTSGLDARAQGIQDQIDEAKALREEASKLMEDAERKAKEADEAAKDIVKRAKADANRFMKSAKADLEARVARREAQAEQRIARAEAEAANDVRRAAANAAIKAASTVLAGSDQASDQFDKALKGIDSSLN